MNSDSEPTNELLAHRRADKAVQWRTIGTVVLAGAVANTGYWFYRESGGTHFFLPMLVLHSLCGLIAVMFLHRLDTNFSTRPK